MGNAIKHLKFQITHSPPDMPEEQVCCAQKPLYTLRILTEESVTLTLCTQQLALYTVADVLINYQVLV